MFIVKKNKENQNKKNEKIKKKQKRENFHFDVQLTTFVFLCHTMFCVDINIVII